MVNAVQGAGLKNLRHRFDSCSRHKSLCMSAEIPIHDQYVIAVNSSLQGLQLLDSDRGKNLSIDSQKWIIAGCFTELRAVDSSRLPRLTSFEMLIHLYRRLSFHLQRVGEETNA